MFSRFLKRKTDSDDTESPAEHALAAIDSVQGALFQVTGPEDGACVCNDWVGAVLSVDGADPAHPSLADAVSDGLFHRGCRHTLWRYDEQASGDPAQARFRTELVQDLLQRRIDAGEPGAEERFTRLYDWARRVDRAGGSAVAVVLCEAALQLLREAEVFGPSQEELERLLTARIMTIRARATNE